MASSSSSSASSPQPPATREDTYQKLKDLPERVNSSNMGEIELVLSGGNAGAMRVCLDILDSSPMGMMELLQLDNMRIYDSRILMLYKDVSGQDYDKMRANMKKYTPEVLHKAIDERTKL